LVLVNRARLELQSTTLTNKQLANILHSVVSICSHWIEDRVASEDILIIDDMKPEEV